MIISIMTVAESSTTPTSNPVIVFLASSAVNINPDKYSLSEAENKNII